MQELQPTSLTATQTREFLSGTIAGRFVIGERLGKGGMGEVYRAEDSKLKRIVALKRLAPHLRADPLSPVPGRSPARFPFQRSPHRVGL